MQSSNKNSSGKTGVTRSALPPVDGNRDDFVFAFADKPPNKARRYALPVTLLVLALGLTGYIYGHHATATTPPGAVSSPIQETETPGDAAGNSLNTLSPASGTAQTAPVVTTTVTTTPSSAVSSMPVPPTPTFSATPTPPATPASVVAIPPDQTPAMPAALTPEPAAVNAAVNNVIPVIGGAATTPAVATAPVAPAPVSGTAAAPVNPAATAGPSGPDAYYDAGGASAGADAAMNVGPRKVDPTQEPASKFIVVNKDESAEGIDAQVVAANRALKLGHYDAAADMFDALYEKNPRDPRILMGRAVAYQNSGRSETAMKMYDELLDIDPNNADALVNMLGLLRKQYPEVALRRLINLHDKYPNNATIAAQIGVTEADQDQFDDAIRYLTMAISMEPNNAQHQFNLGVTEDRAGHKDDAVKYYQQALETDAVYGDSRSIPREKIYDRLAALRLSAAAPAVQQTVQTTQTTVSTRSVSTP